jgi:cyclophilin family peptidyl-prolyl cis-trans isomerase
VAPRAAPGEIARVNEKLVFATAALALAATACSKEPPPEPGMTGPHPVVVLETSMGRIVMELDRTKAAQTVDNIVAHVNHRFYDGLVFHLVIKGDLIQTGQYLPDGTKRISSAPPVPIESDNGLKNVRGTVVLSRHLEPGSGGVEFFINVKDSPLLDFTDRSIQGWGFTVFGKVTEGMGVVDRIAAVRTLPNGVPVAAVVIRRAYVQTPADSSQRIGRPATKS